MPTRCRIEVPVPAVNAVDVLIYADAVPLGAKAGEGTATATATGSRAELPLADANDDASEDPCENAEPHDSSCGAMQIPSPRSLGRPTGGTGARLPADDSGRHSTSFAAGASKRVSADGRPSKVRDGCDVGRLCKREERTKLRHSGREGFCGTHHMEMQRQQQLLAETETDFAYAAYPSLDEDDDVLDLQRISYKEGNAMRHNANALCKLKECNKLWQQGCGGFCWDHHKESQRLSMTKGAAMLPNINVPVAREARNELCRQQRCQKITQSGCGGYCDAHRSEMRRSKRTIRPPKKFIEDGDAAPLADEGPFHKKRPSGKVVAGKDGTASAPTAMPKLVGDKSEAEATDEELHGRRSKRTIRPPKPFVARPSKVGWGVEDGYASFLADEGPFRKKRCTLGRSRENAVAGNNVAAKGKVQRREDGGKVLQSSKNDSARKRNEGMRSGKVLTPFKPMFDIGRAVHAAYWPPSDVIRDSDPSWYPGVVSSYKDKKAADNRYGKVRSYDIHFDDGDRIKKVPDHLVFSSEDYQLHMRHGSNKGHPWLGVRNILDPLSADLWAKRVGWYVADVNGNEKVFPLLSDALRAYDACIVKDKGTSTREEELNLPEELFGQNDDEESPSPRTTLKAPNATKKRRHASPHTERASLPKARTMCSRRKNTCSRIGCTHLAMAKGKCEEHEKEDSCLILTTGALNLISSALFFALAQATNVHDGAVELFRQLDDDVNTGKMERPAAEEVKRPSKRRGTPRDLPHFLRRAEATDWDDSQSIKRNFPPYKDKVKYGQLNPPRFLLRQYRDIRSKARFVCSWRRMSPRQQKTMEDQCT